MSDILIYTGLVIMLIAAGFGLFTAIRGFKEQGLHFRDMILVNPFNRPAMSRTQKYCIVTWGITMAVGFIITGLGIAIGLK